LLSTQRPGVAEAFARLAPRLDAFRTDWLTMRKDACEAALVRGEQSERVLAARNACLDRKLEGTKALVSAFLQPDARSVALASTVVPDPIQECADAAALMGVADTLPDDPALRDKIIGIESGFAVVKALLIAERPAQPLAFELLESARATNHQRTIAEALTWAARATNASAKSSDDRKKAEALSVEGMQLASRVGDDRLFAKTASYLFVIIAMREQRTDEAAAMLPMVDAAVSRAGDDPEQRLEVLIGEGSILMQRGNLEEALRSFEQAVALSGKVDNERRSYGALARGQIGEIYLRLHRYTDAVRSMQEELDGLQTELGVRHPRIIFSLVNLGLAQAKAGLSKEAWATAASLRELVSSIVPAGDWRVATVQYLEGSIHEESGDCARALPLYREAFGHVRRFYGADQANTADVHERLGVCLLATGQVDAAIEQLERTLAIRKNLRSAPNSLAQVTFELADALWSKKARSDRSRAIALAEQALALWRRDHVSSQIEAVETWLRARQPELSIARGSRAGAAPEP
jgi:tetratricopeptide (TPR) repeat protein